LANNEYLINNKQLESKFECPYGLETDQYISLLIFDLLKIDQYANSNFATRDAR